MTEREERNLEKLKSVKDYFNALEEVFDLAGEVPDKQLEKLVALLMKNLRKKYKYIIRISRSYRRRQNIFSVFKDKKFEKERDAEYEEDIEENDEEEIQQTTPIQQSEVELIETTQTNQQDRMLNW